MRGGLGLDGQLEDVGHAQAPRLGQNGLHLCLPLGQLTQQGGIGQRLMIDTLRSQLAVHLLRHYAKITMSGDKGSAFSPMQRSRINDLIESRLAEDISLDDLAEATGLSAFHFSRQFKAEFGLAPYAYVIRKRVAKAQEMLRQGKTAHKVVALDCGFSDQSHFCRTFRKIVGTTPAKYQNEV